MIDLPVRKIRHYGYHRSLGVFNEPVANVDELKIRPEVDPRDVLGSLVENQWAVGSCTANDAATHMRYDSILDGVDPGQLSRFWIYFGERKIEGVLGQGDTGAYGHDAFKVGHVGIPPESAWPYEWSGMEQYQAPARSVFDPKTPPKAAQQQASHYKLSKRVLRVPQDQQAIQAVLSNRQCVSYGFTVYESFESAAVARTGIVPMPQQGEQVLGGHETLIVGYLKSEPHYALCMNSWGLGWGLKGFFLMPWAYICSPAASDLRTIRRTA